MTSNNFPTSPVFEKQGTQEPTTMDFFDALREVFAGKKITKIEWDNENIFGYMRMSYLMIHKDDKDFIWQVSDGDMSGTDWIVLPE